MDTKWTFEGWGRRLGLWGLIGGLVGAGGGVAMAEPSPLLAGVGASGNAVTGHGPNGWDAVQSIASSAALVAIPLGVVGLVLIFRYRRQKVAHETMRLMIEKGLPVPIELINPPSASRPARSDLRRGLIWMALGFGIIIPLAVVLADSDTPFWSFGLIPVFLGGAYLLCWFARLIGERSEKPLSGLWPGLVWLAVGLALCVTFLAMKHGDEDSPVTVVMRSCWATCFIPMAIGAAYLAHEFVLWLIRRRKTSQA